MEKEMKYLKDSMNAEDGIRKGLSKMNSLFENNEQLIVAETLKINR